MQEFEIVTKHDVKHSATCVEYKEEKKVQAKAKLISKFMRITNLLKSFSGTILAGKVSQKLCPKSTCLCRWMQ